MDQIKIGKFISTKRKEKNIIKEKKQSILFFKGGLAK